MLKNLKPNPIRSIKNIGKNLKDSFLPWLGYTWNVFYNILLLVFFIVWYPLLLLIVIVTYPFWEKELKKLEEQKKKNTEEHIDRMFSRVQKGE